MPKLRRSIIRLAASFPKGSEERRAVLGALKTARSNLPIEDWVSDWASKKYPHLSVEVEDKGSPFRAGNGNRWWFLVDGKKVGELVDSGYSGWGNVGYYVIGHDRYEYDGRGGQAPPMLDQAKLWKQLKAYLSDRFEGRAADFVAPPWKGDTREVLHLTYKMKKQQAQPGTSRRKALPAGWLGWRADSKLMRSKKISLDGKGLPFNSKGELKAVIDKMVDQYVRDVNKLRSRR